MRTVAALAALTLLSLQEAKDRRLQENLKDTGLVGSWVYDDLDAGVAEAKKSGKPLLVVFRCVP